MSIRLRRWPPRYGASGGGVPAPRALAGQVRPAEPTIEPEQSDPVGLAGEHPPPRVGDLDGGSEPDECVVSRRQLVEPPPHREVAGVRRLLGVLAREEQPAAGAPADGERLEQVALAAREPGPLVGQLLEQAPERRREERQLREGTRPRELLER